MSRAVDLKGKREAIEHGLDILIFASHATKPFKLSEIRKEVVESTRGKAYSIILILMELGYIEKASCITYQATEFAKEMFGVNVTSHDKEQSQ
ncbi:hypothetical protein [Acinetobacter sp.]|uniref:hypothetical protein n=1 Tax=Acinetobacter sp. TaxID=472 RepID=UPI0028AE0434|nr:hypothetical protein [Acinetobacter sp.]